MNRLLLTIALLLYASLSFAQLNVKSAVDNSDRVYHNGSISVVWNG